MLLGDGKPTRQFPYPANCGVEIVEVQNGLNPAPGGSDQWCDCGRGAFVQLHTCGAQGEN